MRQGEIAVFEAGKLYRHDNTLDVDMFVVGDPVIQVGGAVCVTFLYWNRHYRFFHHDARGELIRERFTIPVSDLSKWKEVPDETNRHAG